MTSEMTFAYQLSASQFADKVSLKIYTITGEMIYNKSHHEVFAPGAFRWNGANQYGTPLAPAYISTILLQRRKIQ